MTDDDVDTTPLPPGWYPDKLGVTRYWDGERWTDHVVPPPPPEDAPGITGEKALAIAAFVVCGIGLLIVMFTQVSVVSGMGTVWAGMAISVGGALLAWSSTLGVVKAVRVNAGVRFICLIMAAVAVFGAISDQHDLDKKRDEINHILNGAR